MMTVENPSTEYESAPDQDPDPLEQIQGFWQLQKDYFGLKFSLLLGRGLSWAIWAIIALAIIAMSTLLLGFALAFWLSDLIGNTALGFLSAAAVYLLLFFLLGMLWKHSIREKIIVQIVNAVHENRQTFSKSAGDRGKTR